MKQILNLFTHYTGQTASSIIPLTASGSNRIYYRIFQKEHSYIGVKGESIDENDAFIYLSQQFHQKGIRVPKVLDISKDHLSYIQEDLGNQSLFQYIQEENQNPIYSPHLMHLLEETIKGLVHIQYKAGKELDYSKCYPVAFFHRKAIMWDLYYFKYYFLKPSGINFHEEHLEDDFDRITDKILQTKSSESTFMYRDFQSRNIMIHNDEPYYIDFQGGRCGFPLYDMVSFLWQGKAHFSKSIKHHLLTVYLQELQQYEKKDKSFIDKYLPHFILLRSLQVLGAYGYRGYFEHKQHFLESIPYVLKNLKELLPEIQKDYPYLNSILLQLLRLKNNE